MNIKYEDLMKMVDRGIVGKVKNDTPFFSFGFRGGSYLGCPGKDIFFILPSLTGEQSSALAQRLANLFPKKPPDNHVKWAACMRYVYGCFEKQGCLRSKQDKQRMIKEDADWSMPLEFMEKVANEFRRSNNKYGLVLHYEMLAHRYGDRAIISKDNTDKMLEFYLLSQSLAVKIKSWKHTFTPYYWAACYFYEIDDFDQSAKYHRLSLKNMEKYCPDAREGYREKAKKSFSHLKRCLPKNEYKKLAVKMRKCKNKCLKKVRSKI